MSGLTGAPEERERAEKMTNQMTGGGKSNGGETRRRHAVLAELLDHWESLRAGRIAPLRSEIDPRRIENVLRHAFILERTAGFESRIRIAGMTLCELMGMEIRAMPATALIAPESRETFSELLTRLFAQPEIIELQLEDARGGMRAEMMLLPMKSDRGEIARILGCLVAEGEATAPPHRFHITGHSATRIIAHAEPQPAGAPMAAGFAEAAQPFTPAPKRRMRPHLRLVK